MRQEAIHLVLAFGLGALSVMLLQILTAAGTHRPRRWGRHPRADWITTLERRKRL